MSSNRVMAFIPVAAIICFFIAFAFYRYNYRKEKKIPYRMLSNFPYEFNEPTWEKNIAGNVFLFISIVLEIVFCGFFDYASDSSVTMYFIVIGLGLASIFCFVLFFVPYRLSNAHLAISLIAYFLVFLVSILLIVKDVDIISYYADFVNNGNTHVAQYTESIISVVFAGMSTLVMFFVLLLVLLSRNPFRLEQVVAEDGTVTYERPQVFALATMEWATLIANLGALFSLTLLNFAFYY